MVIPQVSSLGRFRSIKGIISTPTSKKDGYSMIAINKKIRNAYCCGNDFQLPRKENQNFVNHKNLDIRFE